MGLVCESIEHGLAEPCIGEHLGPLREGQVGGDDDGCLLGSFSDNLEEQLSGDLGQRHIAQFIDDDQLDARPSGEHPAQSLFALGLDELVDQRGGGCKTHTPALTACRYRQAGGEMALAGTGIAD